MSRVCLLLQLRLSRVETSVTSDTAIDEPLDLEGFGLGRVAVRENLEWLSRPNSVEKVVDIGWFQL